MGTQNSQSDLRLKNSGPTQTDDTEFDIDIRSLFLMLWRRKAVLLSVVLVGFSLAAVLVTTIRPQYTTRSMVLIETNNAPKSSSEVAALVSTLQIDNALMLSELEVLRSRSMANMVVTRLNLLADTELNNALKKPDQQGDNATTAAFKDLNLFQEELASLPENVVERQRDLVVSNFLKKLRIKAVPGSFVIQIEYTSHDPIKAARIANAVADLYIEQRLEGKFKAAQKVTDWLDKRLSSLRNQVRSSELAVADYQAKNNLVEGTRTVISAEQLSAMNSALASAKAKRAEAEARLQQIQKASLDKKHFETAAEIVNSTLIQNLKRDEIALERKVSELSSRYGPKHPAMQDMKSQLRKIRQSILTEMDNIGKSIENELRVAEARVISLESSLDEIQGKRNEDNEAMVRLRELQRDADSNRLIFDTFLETYKKSDDQEELQEPEARIISYAIAPNKPSYPNKMMLLSLSAAVSLFIGLALSFFLERMDNTFRSAGQLERMLGFSCYALIPFLENVTRKQAGNYILSKPSSTLAEAVRTLRMVLNLRTPNDAEKPKVITVTSSLPNEGKSTLASWLGRLAAKSGERVIVIDCDLRRPSIHRTIGADNNTTLVDYLTKKKELDEVIQKDDESGAHIIYASSVPNSALDLISSDRMAKLIASLREVYDLVVIDSPACLAVSDARVLAKLSDQTIYAVSWDQTPREIVIGGVKQFTDMGYNALSFVLTNVNIKRHVRYGYGDTIYYYGRHKEYYNE